MLLEVIDDFAPAELFAEANKLSDAKGWYFGHGSLDGDQARFWKMDLEGIVVFDSIWRETRQRCETLAGVQLKVIRQYANGHTYGLGGKPHVDVSRAGSYTLLYYPMAEWKDGWEGETLFYDEFGEVASVVRPKPNRAVLFDSRILHVGRAPARACQDLRVTVAYKLETTMPPAVPIETPNTEVVPDGPVKQYSLGIPASKLKERVTENLTKLGQTIRLPGFRPGKIPLGILESRYGAAARSEAVKSFASEAAAKAPKDCYVASIEVVEEATRDLQLQMITVHLAALPEPDFSRVTLEHLTASDADLESARVERVALAEHLKEQVLDHLEEFYTFPLPGELVEREFATILAMARAEGDTTQTNHIAFRQIAERRIKVGIVVAELARRHQMTGPQIEDQVVEWLISRARVAQLPASQEQLLELAE